MNTDDPEFRDRVREVVRDCFLCGDDANAIRAIRDWRLFDDLKDIGCESEVNFAFTAIGNRFDNVIWQMPRAPITGMRLTLSNCDVLVNGTGDDDNFVVQQTHAGVLEVRINRMTMAAFGTDVSPELQVERAEHERTRAELERVRARLAAVTAELEQLPARLAALQGSR